MVRQRTNGLENSDGGIESSDIPVTIGDGGEIVLPDDDAGIPLIEPASIILEGIPDDGAPKRRKRGPNKNRTSGEQSQKEVSSDLTAILLSVHAMLAVLVKTPELALDEKEAEQLGKAIARVNREYGIQIMSPKTAALVNLGVVSIGVYGPRAVAIMHNAKKKAEEKGKVTTRVM